MMLSDMVVEAWRVIAKGLAGDGVLDIAQAVLSGDQKLVGDETAGKSVVVGTVANDIDRTAVIKKHATKRKWTCSRYRVNRYVNLRTFPTKKAAIDNGIDWCATGVST